MGTFNIKNTDINKQYIKEGNLDILLTKPKEN